MRIRIIYVLLAESHLCAYAHNYVMLFKNYASANCGPERLSCEALALWG
jgi:hypothetical protein